MKRVGYAVLLLIASLAIITGSAAQIFPPEGLNMPGTYDGFTNPPTVNSLAGIQKVGGTLLLDTLLQTRRYHTLVNVASVGGDIPNGTYTWLFTSGPTSNYFQNKWSDVPVIIDQVQQYTYRTFGGSDNSVTLAESTYYTVNIEDNGYTDAKAIWMSTATPPVAFVSIAQSPLPGSVTQGVPVTVTVNLNSGKPPEQNIYVRYTTDNFATSALALVSIPGLFTQGFATIPGQTGGTLVKYYAFSTKFTDPATDIDLVTLQYINNGGLNYSYSVPSPNYTITASSGGHGTITPPGTAIVASGGSQLFTFVPDAGYFVDSIIVDNAYRGDSASYQFTNVLTNHTITVKFAHNVSELFRVNMGVMRRKGSFRPDLGDVVTVRGTFNDFGNSTNNPDTLRDLDGDSIYTRPVSIRANATIAYKFWKSARGGLAYEDDITNRSYLTPDLFTDTLGVVYFDNQYPDIGVTFRVNMAKQREQGSFRPDSGDVITVRGSFNDFGNSTNNPDTLLDLDLDSIYVKTIPISGNQTIQFKFWKTLRDGQDYELIPPTPLTNRAAAFFLTDTVLPAVYFNEDDGPLSSVVAIAKGWNLVSVPRTVSDSTPHALFPSAAPTAFGYNGSSYVITPKLLNGKGYWLRFPADTSASISGNSRPVDSVAVTAGWNLVGSISAPLLSSKLSSSPPGLLTSRPFGYFGRYLLVDTVIPGKGYWLKSSGPGKVYFNPLAALAKNQPADLAAEFDEVTITDALGVAQTLYLDRSSTPSVNTFHELPPVPFEEAFDVRFVTDRFVEGFPAGKRREVGISVRGAAYPLRASWRIGPAGPRISLTVGAKKIPMAGTGSTRIPQGEGAITLSSSGGGDLPASYALRQNYPNPFNPSTTLRYELPEPSVVRLVIFNILGERVAELVNSRQEPGLHALEWNGTNGTGTVVASGVYVYLFEATSLVDPNKRFRQSAKMVLLR